MKLMKSISIVAAMALVAASMLTLTGCADKANEEVIRESIIEQFDPIKNHDDSITGQIQRQNAVTLATIGLDGKEYANALLDGFDYSIEDVTVKGKEASATLVLTQKDISEDQAEAVMGELAADPAFASMSMDEKKSAVADKIYEYIASVPAEPQDPVTIDFVLNGDTWELTETSKMTVANLFTF